MLENPLISQCPDRYNTKCTPFTRQLCFEIQFIQPELSLQWSVCPSVQWKKCPSKIGHLTTVRSLKLKKGLGCLEALSVDNRWSRLIVLLLGDPHLLEGRERSQDRSSDPDRVFSLRGSNDLNLHCGWGEGSQFLLHAISDTREHGGSSRKDDVSVEILSDINLYEISKV